MKYDMCMKRECKNCFKQLECFKKEEIEKTKNIIIEIGVDKTQRGDKYEHTNNRY